jgi:hypothetical protein
MPGELPQTIDLLVQYRLATTAEFDWSDIRIRYPVLFQTLYITSFSKKRPNITEETAFSELHAYLKPDLSLLGVVIDHFIYHRHDIKTAITVVPAQYDAHLGKVPDFTCHECKFVFIFHRIAIQFL